MCGRYRLSRRKQIVEEYFASTSEEQEWEPRYNIAPTQSVPILRCIIRYQLKLFVDVLYCINNE